MKLDRIEEGEEKEVGTEEVNWVKNLKDRLEWESYGDARYTNSRLLNQSKKGKS